MPSAAATVIAPLLNPADRLLARNLYMMVYDDFAASAPQLARQLNVPRLATVDALLHQLSALGLVTATRVNNQREEIWQCWGTYDTVTREAADATFARAWPLTIAAVTPAPEPTLPTTSLMDAFSANFRKARAASGLSQSQAATAMKVAPSYISMLERGQRVPPLDMIEVAARAFGVAPLSLLGGRAA